MHFVSLVLKPLDLPTTYIIFVFVLLSINFELLDTQSICYLLQSCLLRVLLLFSFTFNKILLKEVQAVTNK